MCGFFVFVKFLGWKVAILVRLVRLRGGGLRFWKEPNYKNELYNNSVNNKKRGPRGAQAPLGPHLGPSLGASGGVMAKFETKD